MPQGGKREGAGRKPGIPNKVNAQLKETILEALHEAHPEGAIGYLKEQSALNPNAFLSLIGKVLPLQIGNVPGETFKQENVGVTDKEILERFLKSQK